MTLATCPWWMWLFMVFMLAITWLQWRFNTATFYRMNSMREAITTIATAMESQNEAHREMAKNAMQEIESLLARFEAHRRSKKDMN